MPTNKNAVIRYVFLDQLLSDRYHRYTCNDLLVKLNERLESNGFPVVGSKRIVQLDLLALQDSPFSMEIDASGRKDGAPTYRYADQTQSLISKPLSCDEKRLLREVLNTLGQFTGLDNFEWLGDLQQKLNEYSSSALKSFDGGEISSRKVISFSTNEFLRGRDHLGVLFSFISNRSVIDVEYSPFGEAARIIRMYPYLLKQYNDRWYLIGTPLASAGYPYRRDFYLNLPLDRIETVSAVEDVDYIEPDEGFEDRYEDIIGVTWRQDAVLADVILAIKDTFVDYIDTKPFHGSQKRFSAKEQAELHIKYPSLSEYVFYGIKVKPNRELYNMVYHYGANVLLVSPLSIRSQMLSEMELSVELLKNLGRE